jgi:hypothetical protein
VDEDPIGSLIVIGLVIWGASSLWGWVFNDPVPTPTTSASYSDSYNSGSSYSSDTTDKNCIEPENPYDYDSGHYAGWQWGEEGNFCDGNSDSFIEGCEQYGVAEADYENCLQN